MGDIAYLLRIKISGFVTYFIFLHGKCVCYSKFGASWACDSFRLVLPYIHRSGPKHSTRMTGFGELRDDKFDCDSRLASAE